MFYNYKVLNVNNEEILYLYVNSIYEFSSELDHSNKPKSIFNKVRDYIDIMNIKFNGKKVILVVNGLIIASIVMITNDFSNLDKNNNVISYKENIDIDVKDNIDVIDINSDTKGFTNNEISNDNDGYIVSNFVKMKNKDGRTTYIDLNNYIAHKLSSIIPATYEEEAIKTAAVIVRTETFKDLYENNYLDEENYRSIMTLKKMWNKNFNNYFKKLKSAVIDTNYEYLSNNNYFFNFDARSKYQIPFSGYDANRLAKKGYTYQEILGHFYPDATLEIVSK